MKLFFPSDLLLRVDTDEESKEREMKGTTGKGWKQGEEKRTDRFKTPEDTCPLLYNTELGQCQI